MEARNYIGKKGIVKVKSIDVLIKQAKLCLKLRKLEQKYYNEDHFDFIGQLGDIYNRYISEVILLKKETDIQ